MDNELEIDVLGFWWILDNIDKKWPGRLTFSKSEGGVLEVFQDEKHEELQWDRTFHVIKGEANGGMFTLYKPIHFNSIKNNNQSYYKFKTDTIVLGGYYVNGEDDFKFSELGVKLSSIDEWFRGLIAYKVNNFIGKDMPESITIEYFNESIIFSIDNLLEGSISTLSNLHQSLSTFSTSKQIWFNVTSKDKSLIHYSYLMKKINYLRVFFSLFLGGVRVFEQLRVENSDKKLEKQVSKLYIKNSFGKPSNGYTLFEFEEFRERLSEFIEKWYRLCEEMPEVVNLFYRTYTANPIYDYHFRECYIALEGLYQWKFKQDTKGNIISPLVQPFIHIPEFKKIIGEYKKWWEVAKNNRHYQMHLNKNRYGNNILSTPELVKLMRKIESIILCHILRELGFSDDEINQVFFKVSNRFITNYF